MSNDFLQGTPGPDSIYAGDGDDVVEGAAGNDVLFGEAGADAMHGQDGDDYVDGGDGDDLVSGGDGVDVLAGGAGLDRLLGGAGNDYGAGGDDADIMYGDAGEDILNGDAGDDYLDGGADNDRLYGGFGADVLVGLLGNDLLDGGENNDIISGGDGDDRVLAGGGNDEAEGGAGADIIYGGAGADGLHGQDGDDYIEGEDGDDLLTGGAGADVLVGGGGGDRVYGGIGNDIVVGGDGNDVAYGEGGADTLYGNAGADYLDSGEDDDYASGGDGDDVLVGGAGADFLAGDAGIDRIVGGDGNDYVVGGADADVVYGEAGADTLNGDQGDDFLDGGAEGDFLYGGIGADVLVGGLGNDLLDGGTENDIIAGGDGDDRMIAGDGDDTAEGGGGADIVYGGAGADTLHGQDGNDYIQGDDGDDFVTGGAGADVLVGGVGDDRVLAGADNDIVAAGAGADIVYGEGGNDDLRGEDGADYLDAGDGDDLLAGDAGADVLVGGLGDDRGYGGSDGDLIAGGAGADVLYGEAGDDELRGEDGNDYLEGGTGTDTLTGGAGADTLAISAALAGGNLTTLTDFTPGVDRILLGGGVGQPFAQLASGALAAGAFVIGSAAVDANDYLIYNSITGALLYDADGAGGAAAVQFAALSTGLSLAAADFLVSGPENNGPAITSGATNSIPENSDVSTIVYQAVATDADGDRITYSLSGADASLLTIDAVTGAARLISSADFETKPTYQFNVVASDSGSSTAKAITLTITDVADNASTPIINETEFPNDGTGTAQFVNRNTFLVADNPNLPDDSLPSATIVGSISSNGDKDFFSVTLVAGERLILDVDGTPTTLPGLDTHLRIYNPSGTEIGDNDDLGEDDPGSDPPYSHNTDSQILFRAPTDGTYYFSIESFEATSNGNYRIHVSIAPPATPQQILNEDVDALVSGAEWNHPNLTYGFPTSASQVPPSFSEVSPASDFAPFTSLQQIVTAALLQHIATVSSLTFTQSTSTNGAGHLLADLRYGMSVEAEVAYAYYPTNNGVNSPGGSAWFNETNFNSPAKGNYAWMGILHETGHALGLKHGHEFPIAISPDRDSTEYTVMTYRSYPGDNLSGGYSNEQWGFPQTLMMLDIAALQRMYGANFAHNAGDTVYSWSPTTGEFSVNGIGQGAPGDGVGMPSPSENRIFMTLWDGNGVDTYDFSTYSTNLTVDLRPGEWTKTDDAQRANLGGGHFARGQIANALLHDSDPRSLIENAVGGTGNDLITANQATNGLTGGAGADTFVWQEIAHVGVGAQADVLADFQSGQDKIDLRSIDATSGSPGTNDGFAFIGTGAFTNTAGELRYQVEGANVRVQGDVDGNGVADLEIVVNNVAILSSTDFFL